MLTLWITALIGGTGWVFIPFQLKYLPFEFTIAYRFFLTSFGLFLISRLRREPISQFNISIHMHLAGQGLCLFSLNYILCYMAAHYIPTGLISLSVSLAIIPTAFFGYIFFKEKLHPRLALSMVVGIAGICIVFQKSLFAIDFHIPSLTGCGFALASTLSTAMGTIFCKKLSHHGFSILETTTISMLYGAIFSLIFALVVHHRFYFTLHLGYWLSMFYVMLVTAFLWYIFFDLVEKIGIVRASYLWLIAPVVSMILSCMFEDFHPTLLTWFGSGIVLFGAHLGIRSKSSSCKSPLGTEPIL